MPDRQTPRAASNYKQLRLQLTEERGGHVSVSLYVKPLNADWTERHCLWRRRVVVGRSIDTLEDALSVCVGLLEEDLLPGIG